MSIEIFLNNIKEHNAELTQLGNVPDFNYLACKQFQDELLADFRKSLEQTLNWSDNPTNFQIEDVLNLYLGGDVR